MCGFWGCLRRFGSCAVFGGVYAGFVHVPFLGVFTEIWFMCRKQPFLTRFSKVAQNVQRHPKVEKNIFAQITV